MTHRTRRTHTGKQRTRTRTRTRVRRGGFIETIQTIKHMFMGGGLKK